jgi:hypothetical protein
MLMAYHWLGFIAGDQCRPTPRRRRCSSPTSTAFP